MGVLFSPSNCKEYNLQSNIKRRKIWLLDKTGFFMRGNNFFICEVSQSLKSRKKQPQQCSRPW